MANQPNVKLGSVSPRSVMQGETRASDQFPGVVIDTVPGFGLQTMDRGPGWHKRYTRHQECVPPRGAAAGRGAGVGRSVHRRGAY